MEELIGQGCEIIICDSFGYGEWEIQVAEAYPEIFFLIPGYGAQGGAARIAATLRDKAGGTVNSSRGILCAWKKAPGLADKVESGNLCLKEIADAAGNACVASKLDLLNAKNNL